MITCTPVCCVESSIWSQSLVAMGPFGYFFCLILMWVPDPVRSVIGHEQQEDGTTGARSLALAPRENAFVRSTEGACDPLWTSWPRVQERAIADGTVMVWNMHTSVGNLMRTLMFILPVRLRLCGSCQPYGVHVSRQHIDCVCLTIQAFCTCI